MPPSSTNHWKTDPDHIELLNYLIKRTENVESPMNRQHLAMEFKEKSGVALTINCLNHRTNSIRKKIQSFEHIDTNTKVKLMFALSASVDANVLKRMKKEAIVEVDDKNRIMHYQANNGTLELRGDHSRSAKCRATRLGSKQSLRSWIIDYFENKNNHDANPTSNEEKAIGNLIEFITKVCGNVNSPLNINQLSKDFDNHFGTSTSLKTSRKRVQSYCREIQKIESLDTLTKAKQLFCLSATLDSDCLKELRKDAVVEVDNLNRITKYSANGGRLTLHGDHSQSAKRKLGWIERRKNKSTVEKHLISGGDGNGESEKDNGYSENDSDEYSSEEFDSEFDSDDEIDPLKETEDLLDPSNKADGFDNDAPIRNHSPTEMSINDNFDFDPPTERSCRSEGIEMGEDEGKENDSGIIGNEITKKRYERLSRRRCSDSEDESDYHPEESDDENDDLNKTQDLIEPSNKTDDSDNGTSVRSLAPSGISTDNNFDFDSPTERSHISEGIKIRENDEKDDPEITANAAVKTRRPETPPKSQTSSPTSHTPKTPKRKADASAGSNSSKRTKSLPEESMNLGEMNDNSSQDDLSRVELNPVRGTPGLPNETQKDSDIQQILKPCPQVMETPIKKEYEEESQTSLQTVLKAFKSLILSLDTPGLTQLQMELDKKIMEAGRGVEVFNKEVIMAMDFLIVKLSKHGSPKSSEDSISLRDILLMLRTIILNSSFKGLEVILEMLKKNIDQLKDLDKRVPVSKVECVLRATLDNIST